MTAEPENLAAKLDGIAAEFAREEPRTAANEPSTEALTFYCPISRQKCQAGKVYADPRDSDFYLAVNVTAQASLAPAALEAAFINPTNWTWHDDSTGPAAAPVLSATAEHDLRECWLVPRTSTSEGWVLMYNADFGVDGGHALGYATTAAPLVAGAIPTVSTLGLLLLSVLVAAAGFAALRR